MIQYLQILTAKAAFCLFDMVEMVKGFTKFMQTPYSPFYIDYFITFSKCCILLILYNIAKSISPNLLWHRF